MGVSTIPGEFHGSTPLEGRARASSVVLVGTSFKTSSIALRESVLSSFEEISDPACDNVPDGILERCLLVTCNRIELYAAASEPEAAAKLILSRMPPRSLIGNNLYSLSGSRAVEHLYMVASGLDSLVVGEDQILQQIRDSAARARLAGTMGPVLSPLFASASRVGQRIKESIRAARTSSSVSALALDFAFRELKRTPKRILLIGTGKTAKLAASKLVDAEVVLVSARGNAGESFPGARVIPPERLASLKWEGDLVISATNRPGYSLKKGDLPDRSPTVLLDLAFPRNIDPEFRNCRFIRLFDLDDLAAYAGSVPRTGDTSTQEMEVHEEAERFSQHLVASRLSPTLSEIYRWAEDLRKQEIDQALRMMPDLPEDDRRVIEAMSRSLVGKLLAPEADFAKREDGTSQADKLKLLQSVFNPGAD